MLGVERPKAFAVVAACFKRWAGAARARDESRPFLEICI